jgi:hypothetical protein
MRNFELKKPMRVYVYFNLHKKVFSVRALEGENKGRVVAHVNRILIDRPVFVVSEAGRQRVLREQKKNVHAGVRGIWTAWVDGIEAWDHLTPVTYNPYLYSSFVEKSTLAPVHKATFAVLDNKRIFAELLEIA